jgi:hypothetical protein
MTYFAEWNKKIEDNSNEKAFSDFVEHYYETEQHAYDLILQGYPNFPLNSTAKELAKALEYEDDDMVSFLGFLDGVNESLKTPLNLDEIEDDTRINLDIDYEKLLYNMHEAQAPWLFKLDSWTNVFSEEKIEEIGKRYRTDHIAVSKKIVGRNDPCPCGSGKKYKNCCGK